MAAQESPFGPEVTLSGRNFSVHGTKEVEDGSTGLYLLTGHCICCVVGHSKYREYAFAPSALHLRHPASRYKSSVYTMSA